MNSFRYFFRDDYSEGCHPSILNALQETTTVQQVGYGNDEYSEQARQLIREIISDYQADVHFVSGGTQANLIVISAALRRYQSVITAQTGHINGHEAGAIEAAGHRVETVKSGNGKLTVDLLTPFLHQLGDPNSTQPGMLYVSNTTELGTIYRKAELTALSEFCKEHGWLLFLDGARLPAALVAEENDLTLADIAKLTDVFYVGGTKNGALLGEAIVITNPRLKDGFRYHLKQKGALLAKGRVLGLQFRELFRNGLIFDLARQANSRAMMMVPVIRDLGYSFLVPPESNQLFPILPNRVITQLNAKYLFHTWKAVNEEHAAIRLVTSWATPSWAGAEFLKDLTQYTLSNSAI